MPEHDAHRKPGLPVEDVDSTIARLDGCNLISAPAERLNLYQRAFNASPANTLFRAQGSLRYAFVRGASSDSGQYKLLDPSAVSRTEERADVVHAPHIIQQDRDRQAKFLIQAGPRR